MLNNLNYKSIQVGLKGDAVTKYVNEWIVQITDITQEAHEIHNLIKNKQLEQAKRLMPQEHIYPLTNTIKNTINEN